jgi:hypothetical protein
MLWTIFVLGLIILVGMVVFGLVGGLILAILGFAIKVLLVGAIAYFVIRIFSPKTAMALRAKFGRQSLPRW